MQNKQTMVSGRTILSEKAGGINRRTFLKTAAVIGVTAPSVLSAYRAESAADNKKIRIGIVGCGGRGQWITGFFSENGNYEIVSVADYHQSVAEACAQKFNVPPERCFSGLSGYKKVLNTNIDAIVLEAVPYFYPEHVRASVEAGKHIFMAKPVAVGIWGTREVQQLADRAQKNGKVFLVDFQIPTNEYNRQVISCVRNGDIGKTRWIQTC